MLSIEDGSWWAHGWLSAVIDTCPLWSVMHAMCYNWVLICVLLKLIVYSRDHSKCCGIKGDIICPYYQFESRCHASGQILSLKMSHLALPHSLNFDFGGQWSGCRNCFWQDQLLTMTLCPCSLLLNVQDMILVGSYRFLNCTSTSVDGCCLYIIIHNGMSWWDWGVGLVPWCGRSESESFKAKDAYAYG